MSEKMQAEVSAILFGRVDDETFDRVMRAIQPSSSYVCGAARCKGRRHRLDSLVGRAHLEVTIWGATG